MRRMRCFQSVSRFVGIIESILLVLTTQLHAAPGCPFCPPTQPTVAEKLAEADLACLVKWASVLETKVAEDEFGNSRTTFTVVEVLKNLDPPIEEKSSITVEFLQSGKPGDLFFLTGKVDQDAEQKPILWNAPIEVTELSYGYIRQVPSTERVAEERLRFYLKFLEFPDPFLANDAFAEFSRARYEDVVQLAEILPREKIRRWLETESTSKVRLGFYGLMLGICGNDDDALFLERNIFAPVAEDEIRLGIDGMMGGYLLLKREAGLKKLVEERLIQPQTARSDLFAMLNALRFAGEYCRDRVPLTSVQAATRHYLDREEFAELVLPDLARWKDWSILDRLIASYGREPFDQEASQLKIIQFAIACEKDTSSEPAVREQVEKATQFLNRWEAESPELFRQVRRGGSKTKSNP